MISPYQSESRRYNQLYARTKTQRSPKTGEAGEKAASAATVQTAGAGRFDQLSVEQKDWKQMTIDKLEELSDQFGTVGFQILDFDDRVPLKTYAAFLDKGQYLYVSTGFLQKMSSGAAEYGECSARLEQALKELTAEGNALPQGTINKGIYLTEDQTMSWRTLLEENAENPFLPKEEDKKNLLPWLTEQEKNAKSIFDQDLSRFSIDTKHLLTSPGTSGANVASARTVAQVQNAAFSAKHSLCQLRMALAFTTNDKDTQKLRQAIRQMEKVVRQASAKVKDLQKIQETRAKKERQIRERKRRDARKTNALLNKRKKERFAKDRQISNESIGYLAQVRAGYAQENDQQLNQIMADLGIYSMDAMSMAAMSGMTAPNAISVEVTAAPVNAAVGG